MVGERNMKRRAFTIIELLVVITVMAVLSTIALFGFNKVQAAARDTARQQIMKGFQAALQRYYGENQAYPYGTSSTCQYSNPVNIQDLVYGGSSFNLVSKGYLESIPLDPKTKLSIISDWAPVITLNGVSVCGTTGGNSGAKYYYSGGTTGASYILQLDKESGGTNTFTSP
jgi:prepilin-type N-terminal cleavage/methylation domain-containing protein